MPTLVRFAVLMGLSLALLPAARADEPKTFELLPVWKRGEKLQYEMTRKQIRETDGKVVRNNSGRAPVEVEVITADEKEGYVLRWKLGEMVFDDPKLADNPLIKTM